MLKRERSGDIRTFIPLIGAKYNLSPTHHDGQTCGNIVRIGTFPGTIAVVEASEGQAYSDSLTDTSHQKQVKG
jgi:hypothetical protein